MQNWLNSKTGNIGYTHFPFLYPLSWMYLCLYGCVHNVAVQLGNTHTSQSPMIHHHPQNRIFERSTHVYTLSIGCSTSQIMPLVVRGCTMVNCYPIFRPAFSNKPWIVLGWLKFCVHPACQGLPLDPHLHGVMLSRAIWTLPPNEFIRITIPKHPKVLFITNTCHVFVSGFTMATPDSALTLGLGFHLAGGDEPMHVTWSQSWWVKLRPNNLATKPWVKSLNAVHITSSWSSFWDGSTTAHFFGCLISTQLVMLAVRGTWYPSLLVDGCWLMGGHPSQGWLMIVSRVEQWCPNEWSWPKAAVSKEGPERQECHPRDLRKFLGPCLVAWLVQTSPLICVGITLCLGD